MQQEVIEGYRFSPQQEYLWLLCQQDLAAYRTQCALRLEGELQKSLLKEALQQAVEQHEILRTAFRGVPGMNLPLQVIVEQGTWSWHEVDLSELAEEEQSSQLAALERSEAARAFNHEQGEVLYACLAMLAPARHVLLLNISPLCADSWSLQNLVRELGRRYTARLSGAEVELEAVQYADYSEWQHKLLNTEGAGRDFWQKQNVSDMPVLKLPLERDTGEKYQPEFITLKSHAELLHELETLAQASDASLSELLLAAWSSLLWRLTGEREFVVGTAVDGGRYKELHESLGLFTKYLPVPLRFAATSSFQEIIRRVAASYRDACRRQEYYTPGAGHVAEEGMGYEYEEREETVAGYGPLRVTVVSEESCRSRQRVLLQCRYQSAAKRLELRLRYDAGCYSAGVIKLLAERLETWLQSVVRAPRAELSKVTLLGEAERELLREWGTGAALERAEACETLGEMLEQQARQQGETAAVVGVDEVLTFSELNARANQWGRYLRQRGVGPEAVVGILLERSSRMVECVCGVWKAGAAYLPLHQDIPPARMERVLKQAGVRLVVSERELAGVLAGTGVEVLEWEAVRQQVSAAETSEPEVAVSGENLAYVIYTSGSTGEPKGVMIEQRSVLHLLGGLRQEVYGANDARCVRVGMNAPLSFDASVKQLVQVLRGKTLVVIPEELRLEAGPLLSYLTARTVDVLDCTPAQLRLLRAEAGAEAQWPRLLLVGGEAIDGELWQQLGNWDETDSVNVYGPTEATVDTTWKHISGPSPSIGRPLPQVRVYLLDQDGAQVAIGQAGELYIGGRGVARGYRQAPEQTAERFVPDGYGDEHGGRLYRTGDLARYTEDGELEYVGRTDRQVKLRGFRIELEEVEAALLEHEGVKAAAAIVRREEEKEERLVAYVVPKRQQAAIIDGRLSEAEHPLHTAKLEEQVVGGSLYQLPNRLEVFHHNRNETEHLYHQIFDNQFYLKHGISINRGDCIFDVGANIGLFTLFVYHQVRDASVYSFEPIPSNFEKLRNNVALYGLDVNLFDCGLSNRAGTATFTFYPNWSACSGVYANVQEEEETLKTFLINQGESVAEYADELIEGRYEGEQVVCQLRTLSEVIRQHNIERIDLLKLDVEKSEWDVLEGIEPDDWQKIRQMVVEVHDLDGRLERMQQLLAEQGFVVTVEQESGLVGTNLHSLYARRREAAEQSEVSNGNGTSRLWREALEAEVSEAELRNYLRERLPEYMVPQVLVKLERMPLSRHGKIDYQRLPAPAPVEGEFAGEAARSEVEALLAGIWSEVLGLVHVGREENFFELGGHSLLATQVISRVREVFGVEMRLRELFERPTVKELAQSVERELRQGAGVPALPITKVDRDSELPLSFAQQRLWFIDQLEPGGVVYNLPAALRLQGSLNQEALEQTLTEVISRHEVLRTRFDTVGGQAVQVIEAAAPVELEVVELSALELEEREAQVREWAAQEVATPFDLSRGPLLRVKLLRLAEQEHVVLLTMHHIVSDGWSMGVLIKEVGTLYAAYAAGQESPLAELPIQYADFALWQRAYLQGEVLEQQLAYWRRQLADAPRLLELPCDHPRPAVRSFRGGVERIELDQELSEKLRALSQRESVTLFMLLLAVFKILLMKHAGQADIVIGADVANRNRAETENLIGFFVNMLVLRTDLSGNPTFSELLHRVREVCLEAYAHQDLPFEKLVEELQPERSLSYAPLFQVVFVLQNAPLKDLHLPELTLSAVETESSTAKFDLVFGLLESNHRLIGSLEYSTDLFEAETIKRLLGHFQTLLEAVVADPGQRLSTLPLLTPGEEQQLIEWSNSSGEYPHAVIHQLFEAQVARTPEAVAVRFGEQAISYRELNSRANQLAHYLQGLSIGPESLVALYLDRSAEMVIAILAVLKAGAAYLPLDLSAPAERVAFMLQDAGASVLLTEQRFLADLSAAGAVKLVCLDTEQATIEVQSAENPASGIGPENLAYVIYTSGSSGEPKGALITHANVTRLLAATDEVFHFDERDVWTLFHSYAFDFSVWELFGPLLSGGRVVVVPYLVSRSPAEFYELLQREQVTVLNQTPSAFRQLMVVDEAQREPLALRLVIFGGEALELESLGGWFARHGEGPQLVNMYGITETTVHVTARAVTKTDVEQQAGSVIGRAINDLQLYVLDSRMKPVPVGVAGELYVGGAGLARGYLKRPGLTAEKFVPHPFSARAGERLYRTGDVGRWLNDGGVEYLGRLDEQVKIRGFRIELGEIEAVLVQHPAVREAVVVVHEVNDDKRLVGYVVGEESLASGELRQYLKGVLPEYMVPQVLVQLERLPLTANGKVDRRALPAVEHVREETEMVAAQTPVEEVLVGIWSEVLGVPVGVADDFFELGGHSLLATQVMSRVREAFGVEVGLRELFERPTVKELGQSIERELRQGAGVSALPIVRADREQELPLSFAQQRLWFIDQLAPGGTVHNIPLAVRLSGALNETALEQTLNEIIRRHEVLRTSFAVVDEQPVQVIAPEMSLSLTVQELTSLPELEREAEVMRLIDAEAHQSFDLSRGPLLRVKLWRLSESEHVVLLTMHHIITDGWSLGVLINEVAALYRAFAQGEPVPLPELPVQYADFALWQREHLQGEELERQLSYWRQQLADAPAILELPTDRPRPPLQTFNGTDESFTLSAELTQALQRLSRSSDVTLFMTLLAVWQVLLQRYSGQQDIVVGADVANRNRAETEGLIGFFVNMLVLRTNVAGNPTFVELLKRVKEVCLGAYAHQDLPFEKLVEELQPERSLNHSPLFQVVFALQNAPMGALELPGLVLSMIDQKRDKAQFDLIFNMQETAGQLSGTLHYNTDLFEAATIKRMLGHFQTLLAAVVADPAQQLSTLPLLTEAEAQQLAEWNNTIAEYPREACIHQLFEAQVERTPEAVAISFKDEQLSYRELNQRANQLAHHLQKLGLAPGARVGIYLAHSLETLIAILGVLKAGAAYVPSDPEHPLARLHFVLEDAQIAVLLTETGLAERLGTMSDIRLLCLDADWEAIASESGQNPAPRAMAEDLAYVIYTSGSTGTPKGVEIQHRALVNYIWWAKDVYLQDEPLDFALYSSLAFDLTVTSIFTPLLTGNRVVVYRPDRSSIADILSDDQVGVLKLTPSHLALIKDADNSHCHVKRLIVGGEAFECELARQVYESFGGQVEIFNEYGPTEATVGCMIHRFDPAQVEPASVPIGRPAANVQIYILDEHLMPVPENVVGEVYIAGDGLAAGYLNRADLTGESFISNPFVPEQRMYRTGDLARRLPDEEIEYVGRKDEQVKFHGYRVELNEISSVLNRYPGVRDSVVLVRKKPGHGNDLMIAYYAARQEIEARLLRDFMAQSIIKETIPNVFVHLKKLPLTLNGKVNLEALPDVEASRLATKPQSQGTRTPIEAALATIWEEILSVRQIGVDANFFELGGHSLLATQVMSRVREVFGVEVGLRELFERPTVKELGQSIEQALRQGAGVSALPITSVDRDRELPLSFAQQRLWFIDQLAPGGTVHNIPLAVRLSGALNVLALEQTLNEIIRRHEVLRTSFGVVDEQPVQVIAPEMSLSLTVQELSSVPEPEREAEVIRLVEAEAHQPFDLGHGPLLRVKLWRLSESEHVVLLTMHHIITDGWSLGVLVNEVAVLYGAFAAGEPVPLPELPVQYADFALWQREHLQGEELERQLSYWRQQLADAPALLELPTDRPRPPLQTFNGAHEAFTLSAETTQALQRLSRSSDVTLFMTLLAVWQVLLQRYSSQQDIVVGTSIANRNRAETEGLIGFFVNMLVLRTNVAGEPTFVELLKRVKEVCLGAYAHQDLPFEKLVEELQPQRSLNHSPLFQVVFVLQNTPMGALELPGLVLSTIKQQDDEVQFDLILNMQEAEGQLSGTLRYNTDLFAAATIKRMLGHFQTLLAAVVADPGQQLSTLPLLTEEEEQQLAEWSDSSEEYPREVIHQLFEAQVARTPEAVAVRFGEQAISYRELNSRANQLAHYLQGLSIGPESLVALYLDRSPEMVIAILAVLKAGAAYLPLDLSAPAERVAFMLQDAGASVLVTQDRFLEELSATDVRTNVKIVCLDTEQARIAVESETNPAGGIGPENLAYVIYTSGSSGEPKGALITHANVTRLLAATQEVFHFNERDVWTLFHSYAFDFSVWELFGPLLSGGRVVVVPYLVSRSPAEFYELLQREQVTVLNQTPSAFRQLQVVDEAQREPLALRLVIFGGEALELQSLAGWFARHAERPQLVNMYGITETTVHVTVRAVTKTDVEQQAGSVIGRAIADLQMYVLDSRMKPVPVGVAGELYVGGAGLARGYLKRPALTAEKFVPHPFSARAGERLYRTGDVGRWLNDGGVEYLGRLDEQVKIRGFRIELGEIEAVLSRHEAVREAVVVVQEVNQDKRLVAYVVGEESLASGELRHYLKGVLPEYMVPQVLVQLERLPLTANGKVDRRALPAVEHVREETEIVAAQTPVEEVLVGIWSEVLGVPVGVEDDFFALGGHSLLATQVMSRVREAFGVEVGLRELFERPTVKELGQSIERELRQGAGVSALPITKADRAQELPLSFAQQRLWFIDQLEPGSAVYNVPVAVRLKGSLNQEALEQTLSEVISRHEVLRTRFGTVGGRAVQVIEAAAPVELEVEELSALEVAEREARVHEWAAQEAATPFDLSRGPLLRVKLLRLEEQEHVVLLTMHHIVMDAWSLGVFIREIATLYEAFIEGRPSPLPELSIQYADFAVWQRAYLQGEVLEQQLKYWREQLAGAQTVLKLPTDKPRPAIYSYRGANHRFVLPEALTAPLRKLSQEQGCTLFMTLLASFKTLLYRYTEQEDILVGTAIANRNRSETEDLIGFFVNTLVLRTDLSSNPSFRQLMQRVRETTLGAYVHQDMPFEKLVEELQPERSLSQTPLFQVAFGVHNTPFQTLTLPGLELSQMEFDFDAGRFDLTLWLSESQDKLGGIWYYNTDLFEAATIKRMQGHFETILENVLAQPDTPLSEIEMLTEDEKEQQLVEKRERLESNAQVLRTIRRKGMSMPAAQTGD